MVFYRKYRPQTIDELDLTTVREKLTSILKSGNLPHAFLFTGSKGLGKTSSARILAKAINCERLVSKGIASSLKQEKKDSKTSQLNPKPYQLDPNFEPCNECSACISITNGSNIDVIEIDAASNRGIDEIRDLRDKVKFSPAALRKKVYIIDEVHMLTTEAFNALLKTLEEPPSHVVFILATTELSKLPATIVSRVFVIHFEKPTFEELKRSISRILKGEGLSLSEKAVKALYDTAEGSFRDAAKLLEEVAFFSSSKEITEEDMEQVFKTDSITHSAEQLLEILHNKDAKLGLSTIADLSKNNCDFKLLVEKIVALLRLNLLHATGIESYPKANIFNLSEAQLLLEYLQESYRQMKYSPVAQLPLELVVVKWTTNGIQNSEFKIQNVEQEKRSTVVQEATVSQPVRQSTNDQRPTTNSDLLHQLIDRVKKENQSVAGVLRGCRFVTLDNGLLTLETAFQFHMDKLMEAKAHTLLEKAAAELLKKPTKVIVKMKN